MQIRIYFILLLGFIMLSCNEESKVKEEIAKVEVDFTVERFDKAFFEATPKDLPKLKEAYPFFFSKHVPDSIVIQRMEDTLQNEILQEVNQTFKDFKNTKEELVSMFQHIKYYDKVFSVPRVITLTNNVQYRDNVIVTDSIALVALDNYLGEEHRFYVDGNIPAYLAKNFTEEQIVVDLADGYAKKYAFQSTRKALLDEMIYFGKLLYFKDVMIPFKTDAEKMGYSENQIKWAEANESQIWSYFIEKELLYSTDPKLPNRFIADAPFTKFYLELDNESPGRLGQYMGWQIVKAYAETTGDDIIKIMQTEPEEIFRKSKFKPKK
ncbi:gliding motility lipoprotein GldB [Winogradskyella thalassocola]|uniref:Gliding motility-associated lipoprotein GldB n=1 Tax=Winogradskyella thalassocola TaxID=262004 RepID=A0A1G8K4H5_9FLAO|nr:gliding motility lipoprotein GldB [Winogradskyella thalassocola]SDI38311.1 gliding motility-associated lipoprotein GldB [Winogradskyella thalassocola]